MVTLSFENGTYRVYEFPNLTPDSLYAAIGFCKMFGGRFPYGIVGPIDRYIIIVD